MRRSHIGLVVEDDVAMAQGIGEMLRSLGHEHVHVRSQEEALALVERGEEVCYALVDLQILVHPESIQPRVEAGLNTLELIRQRYPHRNGRDKHHFQVLVMSGHAKDTPSVVTALQNGANDFVVKPLSENKESLQDKIRAALLRSGRENHADCAAVHQRARDGGRPTSPGRRRKAVGRAKASVCRALEAGQPERWVSEAEYRALVTKASTFDLYLNLRGPAGERKRMGGYRDEKGKFHAVEVPTKQALAVAEVMRSERGLREADFFVESVRVRQTFQEGRQKLDIRLKSGKWRSLKTLPGDHPSETRFILMPEKGVRWLLLHDLPDLAPKKGVEE